MASRTAIARLNTALRIPINQKCCLPIGCHSLVLTRAMASTQMPPVAESVKNKQDLFQSGEAMPVYIKGGIMDNILYRFTMGCCLVSVGWILKLIFELAVPQKSIDYERDIS